MIRADLRSSLLPGDLDVILTALADGSSQRRAELERQLAEEGPDALLDRPGLLDRLAALRSVMIPSERLFLYVAMRHYLRASGLDDRELADYLASLVLAFGERDRAVRIAWHDDQQHAFLVDILADLEASAGERRFMVMVHLGNRALWLAGLYPDYIAARRARHGGPDVSFYDSMGRRGFGLASEHALADRYGLGDVFRTAAERFVALRAALNGMSDRFFFPGAMTEGRVLRELGVH
ncbi:MAG TPA: hypothetical protein VFL88_11815 [Gemmatimonadales bacterium]|nr:hypothetical protein [Gemmatimonadales bacterium]